MSIVFENSEGWLLDQCSHINECFKRCLRVDRTTQNHYFECVFKRQYFDILKPHIIQKLSNDRTDSLDTVENLHTTAKLLNELGNKKLPVQTTSSKKRKLKTKEPNQGEIDSKAYHEKVRRVIVDGINPFVENGLSCGYLNPAVTEGQSIPSYDDRLANLCDMAKQLPLVDDSEQIPVQAISDDCSSMEQLDLFTRVTENPKTCAVEVTLMGERYLLPPRCSFLLSDISRVQPLLNYGKRFEAIVLDPPWENKSVKRSNRYNSLPPSQLLRLPIPSLILPGGLVATWVTNRQKHRRFVREELYPHWGVEVLAEWLWVKITRSGEYVFPLDSPHKKPYEVIVLGRHSGGYKDDSMSPSVTMHPVVPDLRLIVSVPSILHSHKPSLTEVFKGYLHPDADCLELFARSLQPGWTSWGNEAIKFQHCSYFQMEPTPPASPPSP